MMVALEGQHSGVGTNALVKVMPWFRRAERVLGMYFRSSARVSSVRMNKKLGLSGLVWVATGAPPSQRFDSSSTAKATDPRMIAVANGTDGILLNTSQVLLP
jgi:hypothetical protein